VAVVTQVTQFGVYLVTLDPTRGSEIRKTRPCLIISPDEMNRHIRTVIVAPMTTASRPYPTRVAVRFQGKDGQIVLDQIRTVDKSRLMKHLGDVSAETSHAVASVLLEMFSVR
jgi:mRNA interferase MazF